jgi:hypothetical protein
MAAAALIGLGVYMWNREHRLRGSAEAAAEAADLRLKGQIVADESSRKELEASVGSLLSENKELQAAYAKARQAAPGARPVGAGKLDTGPLAVRAPPPPTPSNDGKKPNVPPLTECALTQQDKVSVEVSILQLQTDKGNNLVLGTADVYRTTPRYLVASGSFQSELSGVKSLEAEAPPRWGVLALGACGGGGCGPGVGVLFPPVTMPIVRWRAEAFLGVVAAPGALLALGGIGARW